MATYISRRNFAKHAGLLFAGAHFAPWMKFASAADVEYVVGDTATGKIRGVYAQQNAEVVPIFRTWLEPFADLGATAVTMRNTGSTDHVAFDSVGLPGFQFIQDEVEYSTRDAEGLTNHQVAERMFVAPATVKTHLAHIFRKLDVHSRTELSARAGERKVRLSS